MSYERYTYSLQTPFISSMFSSFFFLYLCSFTLNLHMNIQIKIYIASVYLISHFDSKVSIFVEFFRSLFYTPCVLVCASIFVCLQFYVECKSMCREMKWYRHMNIDGFVIHNRKTNKEIDWICNK